jgi:membrane-associated PAP2 superfamily phosphatase
MQRGNAESVSSMAPRPPVWWFVVPALIAIALIAVEQTSDIDREITRFFADPATRAFPLRHSFALEEVMHHWAKYAVMTMGALIGAALVLTYVLPPWKTQRRILFFLLLSIGLAPLSVTIAKAVSNRHCPWDIDEFGGLVPYARLLEPMANAVGPGHCFPAGHASTGFALMAFYFAVFALGKPQFARAALVGGVSAGLVLGLGRVVQGAHFASHVVWSGVLCWAVMLLLYCAIVSARPVRDAAAIEGTDGTVPSATNITAYALLSRSHRRKAGTPRSARQDTS